MTVSFSTSLFLFRRDLRVEDNTGLIFALKNSKKVIPAFIFTPEQITHNSYRSDHCLQFMLESLEDLEAQLKQKGGKLFFFEGKPDEVVRKCLDKLPIDGMIVNRDYTPYSIQRDKKLEKVCKEKKVPFHSFDDALLHPPEETLKEQGKPYTLFTPYFRKASKIKVEPPVANRKNNYFTGSIPFAEKPSILSSILPEREKSLLVKGGRKEGMKILKKLSSFRSYTKNRDFPEKKATTHLSAYLKFTTLSPREVYAALVTSLGKNHELVRALYWRDFFSSIAFFFPDVFKGSFHKKFNKMKWSSDRKAFQKWCKGQTGFPIVDAGMREMNETGFMHNRVRMVVASFLTKDLHIDWRWGEKYFAQKLIDYDPSVNNGNWQWCASTGCDAQPYFRVFNPWLQQKKFDPNCSYIKTWIPELKDFSAKEIHQWGKSSSTGKYPLPIVDHEKEAKKALSSYRSSSKR